MKTTWWPMLLGLSVLGEGAWGQGLEVPLTSGTGTRGTVRWSRDGQGLFYARNDGGLTTTIWKVSIHGGPEVQVSTEPVYCLPDFSPDGQFLVYTAFPSALLRRIRTDGTEPFMLLDSSWGACTPIWSPDGRVIAATARLPGGARGLAIVDARNGGVAAQFVDAGDSYSQRWVRPGDAIVYHTETTPPGSPYPIFQIVRLEFPGGMLRYLTSPPYSHGLGGPSPDGEWLSVGYALPNEPLRNAGIMPVEGGPIIEVSRAHLRVLRGWHASSDSIGVLEWAGSPQRLVRLHVPGGQEVELIPWGRAITSVEFSPDGNYLAYTRPDNLGTNVYLRPVVGPTVPALVGTGRVGTDLAVHFHVPGEAGAPYIAAASLSRSPGIPIGGRTIPLMPDPLLLLSLAGGGVFEGFQGALDGGARAQGAIHVPDVPQLGGLRFWIAFVTLSASAPEGIRTISAPRAVFLFP